MDNFWEKLNKPFFVLAPMDGVTETTFRQVLLKTARPEVFFTEFINCDGLASEGKDKLLPRLKFTKAELPLVAQIWGIDLDHYTQAARMIKKLGFAGVDINMGCPDKKALQKGACAALIDNPQQAVLVIKAVKKGAENLPVSVKTRLGVREIKTEQWISFLLKQDLQAITIHGRTVKEMSKVEAHWEEIGQAVKLRNRINKKTLIIGNGDVKNRQDGLEKVRDFGVDGIMIGRGIFQNLWAFAKKEYQPSLLEMINLLKFHSHLFVKTYGKKKNFNILKKFFKIYTLNFPNIKSLRVKLMESSSVEEIDTLLDLSKQTGLRYK